MMISINFQTYLALATIVCGIIALLDVIFWAKKRKTQNGHMPVVIDYARSFFPILLIVLIIRSFIIQPFRVPTGSLEPTVLPNDFIAVNQFAYGLRLPITNTKIFSVGEPKTGDIVVFHYPNNPNVDYVKRVIGTPGDHIAYKEKTLYINGKKMSQQFVQKATDYEPPNTYISVDMKEENLNGIKHKIFVWPYGGETQDFEITVPPNQYFMMGDNRDMSADSRYWGFVPEQNLVGKAFRVWLSWDSVHHRIRWDRMGNKL